jgi:hypothetical protein
MARLSAASPSGRPTFQYAHAVEQAIFGLIGVLVGGAITWGIEWWREHQRQTGDVRVAARLVTNEIARAWALLATLDEHRDEAPPEDVEIDTEFPLWRQHRAVLARTLDGTSWFKVEAAFIVVATGIPRPQEGWKTALREALEVLRPLTGIPQHVTGPRRG